MVAIEDVLKLVGTPRLGISGSKNVQIDVAKEARDSERAKHNVERMDGLQKKILGLIKKRYKFDISTEDSDVIERELMVDGVKIADVQLERRYRKTAYKKVVEEMEDHLEGIAFHKNRGRHITDTIRRNSKLYIHAERLLEDFDIILGGNLGLAVEYNVNPLVSYKEPRETLIVPEDSTTKLSANSIRLLAQIGFALPLEKAYLTKYNKEAAKGAPNGGVNVTEVSSRKAVEGGHTEKDLTDYTNIVRSLIPVPTEDHTKKWDPELPYLVRKDISFESKKDIMPWYELATGRNGERLGVYVGIKSVYERLQELKENGARKIKVPFSEVKSVF